MTHNVNKQYITSFIFMNFILYLLNYNDILDPTSLKLPASKSTILAIERCWSEEVFIYGLSHRFWKLTLQVNIVFRMI